MIENLLESKREARSWHRSQIVLLAVFLHVFVVGWVMAHDYLKIPPIQEPQLTVEFLHLESPPPPPPPTGSRSTAMEPELEHAPEPEDLVTEIPMEMADLVLEPVAIAEEIELTKMPELPPRPPVRQLVRLGKSQEELVVGSLTEWPVGWERSHPQELPRNRYVIRRFMRERSSV